MDYYNMHLSPVPFLFNANSNLVKKKNIFLWVIDHEYNIEEYNNKRFCGKPHVYLYVQ